MSDPKLLNCPFCGGLAGYEQVDNTTGLVTWSVGCQATDVDCIAYQMMAHYARKAEAAEAWNKRVGALGTGVTPEMVRLVKEDSCQSCGAYNYENCKRHPQRDCYREFSGGKRNVDDPAI